MTRGLVVAWVAFLCFTVGWAGGAMTSFREYRRQPAWELAEKPKAVIARLGQPTSVCGVWIGQVPIEPRYGEFSAMRSENLATVCELHLRGQVHWVTWERGDGGGR